MDRAATQIDEIELTAKEAGLVIGRSYESIRRYALQGRLDVTHRGVGNVLHVRVGELRRFAAEYNYVWNNEVLEEIIASK